MNSINLFDGQEKGPNHNKIQNECTRLHSAKNHYCTINYFWASSDSMITCIEQTY